LTEPFGHLDLGSRLRYVNAELNGSVKGAPGAPADGRLARDPRMPKDFNTPPRDRAEAEGPLSPPAVADAPEATAAPKPRGWKRLLLGAVAAVALGAAAWFGYGYWTAGRFMVETDDAYVQADFAVLAPKITGYVAAVPAAENQAVKAGDPLVVLEDGDYRDALALAEAQLAAQQAAVTRIDAQARAADASVEEARARVEAAQATETQTAADLARYQRLASSDVASAQRLEAAKAAAASAAAAVREAEAGVATAEANRAVIAAQKAEAEATIAGLAASRDRARRDLESTVLRAPFDGTVGNLSVAVGDLVGPGKRLLAVVPLNDVYVEANFKETQIAELRPGTQVHLHFDAFPERDVVGRVDGIAPASGAQFSLLPPENATGNFTKVVQRVPVRISVPAEAAAEGWLRPGLSVAATADIRSGGAPAGAVAAR
jgi:membrane fusion protein (multidrug efflux system)